jgi:alpha-N-arabinofuranosidase
MKTSIFKSTAFVMILVCLLAADAPADDAANPTPVLQIKIEKTAAKVSPMFYGLMTEEINYCYDGGLYGELVRNRIFKEVPMRRRRGQEEEPQTQRTDGLIYWNLVRENGGAASMSQDSTQPMNDALTNSLKLEITSAGEGQRAGISNDGFWGFPIYPNTTYRARIHAKASDGFTGPLMLALVSDDGKTVYAKAEIPKLTGSYQKYEAKLTTGTAVKPTAAAKFHIWAGDTGTVWFSLVSLFPPTYKDRPNGNRPDIMQLLVDMKPAFLRFPGGNYLEGQTIETRFDWKRTIGDIAERPGHPCDAWGYWSSDGMGLLEFLEWCEDMGAEPVVGIYAGYSFREHVDAGDDLKPYVQDALDEIEYITGGTGTRWGARRAKDGHPKPFKLTYVEIGNEENLGNRRGGGNQYDARFTQFYDAIKGKYPDIKIIAATPVDTDIIRTRKPDVYDDHFYRNSVQMQSDTHHYDNLDRNDPKVFVGEWATREGAPTPNMGAAVSDAAWMTGMERNSDIVIMEAYAPLFVNVNPGAMQWPTDLIGFDTLACYGSPAYYAQKMFSNNHGDVVLSVEAKNIPARDMEIRRRRFRRGGGGEEQTQIFKDVPSLFCNVTRDSKSGTIYVKVVNCIDKPQPVKIQVVGVDGIASNGQLVQMKADSAEAVNSIDQPKNIVPVTSDINGLSKDFTRTFPPYSISVLKLQSK